MSDTATAVTRFAIVGTGGRLPMFTDPIAKSYTHVAQIVGLCDVNPGRLEFHQNRLVEDFGYDRVPTFLAEQFDQMVQQTKPDVVIVTTVDAYHHQYIVRAMELGCDVITEKPMTIDDQKCAAIFDAIERTGRKLRVTFNYRWGPGPTLVRKLLQEDKVIGDIVQVDMEYLLNTSHGADYFRRWHREKDKSGGLMVHKSTHHFDLVNWWLNAVPQTVFGFGKLAFYGKQNAAARGIKQDYERYTGNVSSDDDPFALDLNSTEQMKKLYLEQEKHDGYIRDRNVFGEPIDIEDTMSVLVKYKTDVTLNYSLNAYLPKEGFHVVFNGTKGRIEYQEAHASHIIGGQSDEELAKEMKWDSHVIVHPMFGNPYTVDIPHAEGGHGGGDPLLQQQMFDPDAPADPYGRNAGHEQGAASIMIGISANQCFKTGTPVNIGQLCPPIADRTQLSELI